MNAKSLYFVLSKKQFGSTKSGILTIDVATFAFKFLKKTVVKLDCDVLEKLKVKINNGDFDEL